MFACALACYDCRHNREDGRISTHLSHTFLALNNEMKRIYDLFERSSSCFQCSNDYDDNDNDNDDTNDKNSSNILAYRNIIFSLLCKYVLNSYHNCIEKLNFDCTKEGVMSRRSLNPALYQAQEELECLKYVFFTYIPVKYRQDWTSTFGEKMERSIDEEDEQDEKQTRDRYHLDMSIDIRPPGDNCWEWENILTRSRLFVASFSAWWVEK